MRLRQIRLRMLLAILVVAASVPVTLLTFALLLRSWDDQAKVAERQIVETARAVSVSVDQEVESAITALNVLANLDVFDAWSLPRFQDAALRLVAQRAGWLGLVLLEPSGRFLAHTASPSAVGSRPAQTWSRVITESRRAAVSDLTEDPATRQHFVAVGVPVMRNGNLQFVLAAHLSSAVFDNILRRQNVSANGAITLTDATRRIIARTRGERAQVGQPPSADFVEAAGRMEEGTWHAKLADGQTAYAGMSRSALTGWTVGISQPSELIDAPIRNTFWMLAAASLVVLAMAIAIALALSRALMRSLSAATLASQALARGHPIVPPENALVAELQALWNGLREAQSILGRRLHERDQADRERVRALEAERVARESSEKDQIRLAVTLGSIADAVLASDQAGRVVMLNPIAETLTGWHESEALGRPVEEVYRIVDEGTHAPAESPVARIYRAGRISGPSRSVVLLARDGREFPIEESGAPIATRDGRVLGVVLVFRDASKRREAEKLREALLAREQAARQDAESLNQSKDQFVAMISHELRAPLNAIYGWVQLLQGGKLDPAQQSRALEVIERSTRAQTQLIDDLLDMSRVLRGSLRLELCPLDLSAAVHTSVETVRPAAAAKLLELELSTQPGIVISADPDRLQQILGNVLGNAIKFTPQGGRIDVKLHRQSDHALIVVRDSGIGIEADLMPHLFEAFRQGESASKRAHGGLGIGLALVHNLVEKHGGTVSAHSEGRGKGAAFTMRFPLYRSEGGAHEDSSHAPASATT
ncbi:MAG: sensor histidine kinase [Betaproteobacteria bacterium]|nr:MAG: sensor histidine kinase [Betaproteobacteria bacterium]